LLPIVGSRIENNFLIQVSGDSEFVLIELRMLSKMRGVYTVVKCRNSHFMAFSKMAAKII